MLSTCSNSGSKFILKILAKYEKRKNINFCIINNSFFSQVFILPKNLILCNVNPKLNFHIKILKFLLFYFLKILYKITNRSYKRNHVISVNSFVINTSRNNIEAAHKNTVKHMSMEIKKFRFKCIIDFKKFVKKPKTYYFRDWKNSEYIRTPRLRLMQSLKSIKLTILKLSNGVKKNRSFFVNFKGVSIMGLVVQRTILRYIKNLAISKYLSGYDNRKSSILDNSESFILKKYKKNTKAKFDHLNLRKTNIFFFKRLKKLEDEKKLILINKKLNKIYYHSLYFCFNTKLFQFENKLSETLQEIQVTYRSILEYGLYQGKTFTNLKVKYLNRIRLTSCFSEWLCYYYIGIKKLLNNENQNVNTTNCYYFYLKNFKRNVKLIKRNTLKLEDIRKYLHMKYILVNKDNNIINKWKYLVSNRIKTKFLLEQSIIYHYNQIKARELDKYNFYILRKKSSFLLKQKVMRLNKYYSFSNVVYMKFKLKQIIHKVNIRLSKMNFIE